MGDEDPVDFRACGLGPHANAHRQRFFPAAK
jgi:hypothetical protein